MAPRRESRAAGRTLAVVLVVASVVVFFLGALSLPYFSLVPIYVPGALFGLGLLMFYSNREV